MELTWDLRSATKFKLREISTRRPPWELWKLVHQGRLCLAGAHLGNHNYDTGQVCSVNVSCLGGHTNPTFRMETGLTVLLKWVDIKWIDRIWIWILNLECEWGYNREGKNNEVHRSIWKIQRVTGNWFSCPKITHIPWLADQESASRPKFKPHHIGKLSVIQHILYSLNEHFIFWKLHPKKIQAAITGRLFSAQTNQAAMLDSPPPG